MCISIYCMYEPINKLQVYLFVARIDRLWNCARHPGKVCKSGIYEQIMKSRQNQGKIFGKYYFGFSCGKYIPTPVSKNLHYILNFGINPNKNRIIKILFYEFIFAMIGGVQKNSHYLAG